MTPYAVRNQTRSAKRQQAGFGVTTEYTVSPEKLHHLNNFFCNHNHKYEVN